MSAIWDQITGKDKAHPQDQPPLHNTSHPPPVATEATTQTLAPKHDEEGFSFAKVKDALLGHTPTGTKQPELPPPIAVTNVEHGESNPSAPSNNKDAWHEKFRDLLDRGASNKHEAEEERLKLERDAVEKEISAKEAEEKASVKGKLKGLFKSDEEEAAEHKRLVEVALEKRREAEIAKKKEHSFSAKIKDVFDDDSEEKEKERQRLAEEAKRNQSFGAKIRNIFDHHDTPAAVPEKRHPWSRTPTPEPKKDWTDKFTGGHKAKAEAHEGKLDKAIDLYQEHVLHDGPQNNESLLEQAKDSQIASAIRHAAGIKDNHHH